MVIDSPADTVWSTVRDFHDVSWASGVLRSCEAVGAKTGDQVGAKRILNGVFHETLVQLSDTRRTLRYTLDEGPSPVSSDDIANYVSRLRVFRITEGGGAFVEWSSSWDAKDDAACDFCHVIYVALLGQLRKTLLQRV